MQSVRAVRRGRHRRTASLCRRHRRNLRLRWYDICNASRLLNWNKFVPACRYRRMRSRRRRCRCQAVLRANVRAFEMSASNVERIVATLTALKPRPPVSSVNLSIARVNSSFIVNKRGRSLRTQPPTTTTATSNTVVSPRAQPVNKNLTPIFVFIFATLCCFEPNKLEFALQQNGSFCRRPSVIKSRPISQNFNICQRCRHAHSRRNRRRAA